MNAEQIRDALSSRWPTDANVFVREAPDGPMRMGRKLDVLVCSTWKSRGYEIDGVEIKCSMSDWARERDQPAKADWWYDHVHRFWIAAPAAVAAKIRPELPDTFGLLAVDDGGKAKAVVKAPKHAPTPFAWGEVVGLLRAAQDAGPGALMRQFEAGRRHGFEQGQQHARPAPQIDTALRDRVAAFEAAAGIDLSDQWANGRELGTAVAIVRRLVGRHASTSAELRRVNRSLTEHAEPLLALADVLDTLAAPQPEG